MVLPSAPVNIRAEALDVTAVARSAQLIAQRRELVSKRIRVLSSDSVTWVERRVAKCAFCD